MVDQYTDFTDEEALTFLRRLELRMQWDQTKGSFTIRGFPCGPDSFDVREKHKYTTTMNALKAIGLPWNALTHDEDGKYMLRCNGEEAPLKFSRAGFSFEGDEDLLAECPLTRAEALAILKPYENKMHWNKDTKQFTIDGLTIDSQLYNKPYIDWPDELAACSTLLPHFMRFHGEGVRVSPFQSPGLPYELKKAGFVFDGVEDLMPTKWGVRSRKDEKTELLIQALERQALYGEVAFAWDKQKGLVITNQQRQLMFPDPWVETVCKVWAVVGVEGYNGNGAEQSYSGKSGVTLAKILQEAGLEIKGLPKKAHGMQP